MLNNVNELYSKNTEARREDTKIAIIEERLYGQQDPLTLKILAILEIVNDISELEYAKFLDVELLVRIATGYMETMLNGGVIDRTFDDVIQNVILPQVTGAVEAEKEGTLEEYFKGLQAKAEDEQDNA